ncbi:hypothetical protein TNCV_2196981 [Trichonephila clavipes]|nr:hypothetical protein TNCV_2196981 [Trichonephila clavipes]
MHSDPITESIDILVEVPVDDVGRNGDQGPAPFSIPLHPAGRRGKKSLGDQGVVGEVQGGPHNNFQHSDAECTCDDYFHKEADSQLGGDNVTPSITLI